MRTIKTLLLAVTITVSSVLSANATTEPKTNTKVAKEIGKLLKNPKFLLDEEVLVMVKVTVNDKNEMVVLSTDSESLQVENYIKKRLNYTELDTRVGANFDSFNVPVRLVPIN